mmetsp:Transcript_4159/g.12124  ORF Transcript_4159/g.12124 Transcript_4159/m.12124 type:complete len:200 (-) Transcript_4159:743-1342(-)
MAKTPGADGLMLWSRERSARAPWWSAIFCLALARSSRHGWLSGSRTRAESSTPAASLAWPRNIRDDALISATRANSPLHASGSSTRSSASHASIASTHLSSSRASLAPPRRSPTSPRYLLRAAHLSTVLGREVPKTSTAARTCPLLHLASAVRYRVSVVAGMASSLPRASGYLLHMIRASTTLRLADRPPSYLSISVRE